ncbi:MAG: hypothetical protein Q8914_13415, partial [Bacteroidota bacterium]|nr:hypothetical protein [Bacteroidota bacterium]
SVAFPDRPLSGLGHSGSAICLKKGERATYSFETVTNGSARLGIYSLPDHAADGGDIRYQVVLDKMDSVVMNTRTFGRSMEWKENVLRNQAVRWIPVSLLKPGLHTLTITALDDDVVLDQLQIQFSRNRKQYLVVH